MFILLGECKTCGVFFEAQSRKYVYCSRTCKPKPNVDKYGFRALRLRVFERDGFICRYCGRKLKGPSSAHLDHVHPRSKGGTDDPQNLVTACPRCNGIKATQLWKPKPNKVKAI